MPASTKRKAPAKLAAPVVKSSARRPTKSSINESKASVSATDTLPSSAVDMIEISSDQASEDDVSDEEEDRESDGVNGGKDGAKPSATPLGLRGKTVGRDDADAAAEESDGEATSPSFGELLRNNEAIDVPALLQQSGAAGAVAERAKTVIVPPSHQSLTTVLTQALRTDDTDLLESCLHTTDLTTIRNTIERIDSALAGNLLTRLAARLHRRPGRAGNLMTWVQWTLVSHGGALASQPKVVHSLNGLQKVLAERAKGLNSLLVLKGKLDLLEGQMNLRKKMQQKGPGLLQQGDADDDEDAIWVEGETGASNGVRSRRNRDDDSDDDDDDDDAPPEANGFVGASDDDDDDSVDEDDDEDGDDADEPLDEDEVIHDDVDESMGEDEESDVEAAAPPSKLQKVTRSFAKRK
ncbi:hypothetical protein DCS_05491 [Drechmeria coniospora]|uniref:Small-subunit processome Utp12 domain-containing protein n=1 Tax=Drechmeria coniospora TaxID=98403 RepID=A0A151GMY4_DRECN|nr:hypothetical protein DCS_05491 [Drechmeria coniospora]KYK58475.1 hypothetical protein DCS_05491 [Drechmeria coniospora]